MSELQETRIAAGFGGCRTGPAFRAAVGPRTERREHIRVRHDDQREPWMDAISASPTQARNRMKYERRQPTSIALTLRNLIVLTIRKACTSTIASAGNAVS